MDKGYFVYREKDTSVLKQYWHRREGKWTKFFCRDCIYPTYKGADRQAESLIKEPFHFKKGAVIGVSATSKKGSNNGKESN